MREKGSEPELSDGVVGLSPVRDRGKDGAGMGTVSDSSVVVFFFFLVILFINIYLFIWLHQVLVWRRKWQPIPVFLPGESQGWQSLVGCHRWGCTESDMTEAT